MQKVIPVFIPILLLVAVTVYFPSNSKAQQPTTPTNQNTIPSDLFLDLRLAQQDPAPEQKTIVQAETQKAVLTTDTGSSITIQPQDSVALKQQTESIQDAIHPDQTTSEQVVTVPVVIEETVTPAENNQNQSPTEDQNQPNSTQDNSPTGTTDQSVTVTQQDQNGISPSPSETVVPDTTVTEPNDNAAPSDNSTNPDLPAPTQSPDGTTLNDQNTTPQPTGSSNSSSDPATQQSSQDSSSPNSESADTPTPDGGGGSDGSVQGAHTMQPPNLLQNIFHFFFGKN